MKNLIVPLLIFTLHAFAQTITGTVTTSGTPVRFASITFSDMSDLTRTFTALTDTAGYYRVNIVTAVQTHPNVPRKFVLEQNYPNPFSSSTTIPYTLPEQTDISVRIYNVLGQLVKEFKEGAQPAGGRGIVWDGKNMAGVKVSPGVYFYQLTAGKKRETKKMLFGFGGTGTAPAIHAAAGYLGVQQKTMNTSQRETQYYIAHIDKKSYVQNQLRTIIKHIHRYIKVPIPLKCTNRIYSNFAFLEKSRRFMS